MKRMLLAFWITPNEEEDFLLFIQSTGNIVVYTPEWKQTQDEVKPIDLFERARKDSGKLIIGPENAFIIIESHQFGERALYNITTTKSTVISYERGQLQNDKLGQSSLAAYWDIKDRPDSADETFHAWCKKIYGWVKKRAPHRHPSGNYRFSTEAQKGEDEGLWRLVLY